MDLRIIESFNGGDLLFANGDIQLTSEVYNQPYLAHFGGNIEQSTEDITEGEIKSDWWANSLLLSDNQNEQLNSKFEKSLNEIALSSSGRIQLQEIAKEDLSYLESFSESESTVKILSIDKIRLSEQIYKGSNNAFSYIWEEAKDQIIDDNSTNIN